ncbi:MAG: hypothetical protein Q3962_07515 [Corynebacterium sp.]|nr:hypothetical protein [Corynebacterium sp.]
MTDKIQRGFGGQPRKSRHVKAEPLTPLAPCQTYPSEFTKDNYFYDIVARPYSVKKVDDLVQTSRDEGVDEYGVENDRSPQRRKRTLVHGVLGASYRCGPKRNKRNPDEGPEPNGQMAIY